MTTASAAAKAILLGEHAVVYGRPAIAVPLSDLRARVQVKHGKRNGIWVDARDLGVRFRLNQTELLEPVRPLVHAIQVALAALCVSPAETSLEVIISSQIPIASGMGSGAAVSSAITRALALHFGRELEPSALSSLVYETELLLHGTPSGIDNTVICYEQPVYFSKASGMRLLLLPCPLTLVLADTGIRSSTRQAVGWVRDKWQQQRAYYESLFDRIAKVVAAGRTAIEKGALVDLGRALNENHRLLQKLGVSNSTLDTLVAAAQRAGAMGAKLSGAGLGGCMLALVEPEQAPKIAQVLRSEGAKRVFISRVEAFREA